MQYRHELIAHCAIHDIYIGTKDICAFLGIRKRTFLRLCRSHGLPAGTTGGGYTAQQLLRIPAGEIQRSKRRSLSGAQRSSEQSLYDDVTPTACQVAIDYESLDWDALDWDETPQPEIRGTRRAS